MMADMKPILFNADMVCATLDGRKRVTRRSIKQLDIASDTRMDGKSMLNLSFFVSPKTGVLYYVDDVVREVTIDGKLIVAPYRPGDILYVRETWAVQQGLYWHRAGLVGDEDGRTEHGILAPRKWRPSIHMPREAARIFLRVMDVRAERLQNMNHLEANKEGQPSCSGLTLCGGTAGCPRCEAELDNAVLWFSSIWDGTIKPADLDRYGWAANPWVWVIEFERIEKPKEV